MLQLMMMPLLVALAAANYCSISTCDPAADNTMCLYPTAGAASSCGTVLERGVSDADKKEILDAHNTVRRAVKRGDYASNNLPAALEIPDLIWDDELATMAQRWTDQCIDKHDKCRNVKRFQVGQNIAWTWRSPSSPKDWTSDSVGQWFHGELPHFTQKDLTFVWIPAVGHLTQVIWAKTRKVGCGYIAVEETQNIPGYGSYTFAKRTYICNYGPAGNFIGQPIYVKA